MAASKKHSSRARPATLRARETPSSPSLPKPKQKLTAGAAGGLDDVARRALGADGARGAAHGAEGTSVAVGDRARALGGRLEELAAVGGHVKHGQVAGGGRAAQGGEADERDTAHDCFLLGWLEG